MPPLGQGQGWYPSQPVGQVDHEEVCGLLLPTGWTPTLAAPTPGWPLGSGPQGSVSHAQGTFEMHPVASQSGQPLK